MAHLPRKTLRKYQRLINQTDSSEKLENLRIKVLGRKGIINSLFIQINQLPHQERKKIGQELNQLKAQLEKSIEQKSKKIVRISQPQQTTAPDNKNSYRPTKFGHFHPITTTIREINAIFKSLGFSLYDGPETETDEYCFQRLNVPRYHPARDLQDTIYIKEPDVLLRTQASSIEAHLLENEKPPFKVAFPGRVYRNEKVNKSNHFIFHHYQGVAVDKNISLKDLIGTLNILLEQLYSKNVITRYRCKYYPEVEPGMGLDIRCFNCRGKGCSLCKKVGWIEMGGAGIIHPLVLQKAGIDPQKWRGFAFGLGLDRWVMAKYNIKDIRTLLGGNLAYKPNTK